MKAGGKRIHQLVVIIDERGEFETKEGRGRNDREEAAPSNVHSAFLPQYCISAIPLLLIHSDYLPQLVSTC